MLNILIKLLSVFQLIESKRWFQSEELSDDELLRRRRLVLFFRESELLDDELLELLELLLLEPRRFFLPDFTVDFSMTSRTFFTAHICCC